MLVRHSAVYLLARGVPAAVNFLSIAVYTRLLTPDQYGMYALVVAWVSLGNAVFFQWLRLGVLRFLPSFADRRGSFLSTVAVGFAALILITGALSLVWGIVSKDRGLITIGLALLWLQALYELGLEMSRAELRPVRYGLMSLLKSMIALVLGGGLAFSGLGVIGVLAGVMVANLVPGVWATLASARKVRFGKVDWAFMRELVHYGLPLTVTFALGYIVTTSDRLLLGWLRGADEAGLYSVGYDLAQSTLGVLMMVVNLAAYPIAVKELERGGVDAARRQLKDNVTALLAFAVPAAAGLSLLATNISTVFIGQAFRAQAASIIPWVALGALLNGIKAFHVDVGFQLGKRTIRQVWSVCGAAVTNVLLNVVLIPQKGALGAAYSTVVAYAVGLLLSWGLSRQVFPLPFPVKEVFKIVVSTIGMVVILLPVTHLTGLWGLVTQMALGVVVYGMSLVLLNFAGLRKSLLAAIPRRKLW